MGSVTIRNLPRELIEKIKAAARDAGRSMEQELRCLLDERYNQAFERPAGLLGRCARCGGHRLEPGSIQSTGKLFFRPANTKFLTLKTADVAVRANICLDCGVVELVGDARKARELTSRTEPH